MDEYRLYMLIKRIAEKYKTAPKSTKIKVGEILAGDIKIIYKKKGRGE